MNVLNFNVFFLSIKFFDFSKMEVAMNITLDPVCTKDRSNLKIPNTYFYNWENQIKN